MIKKSFFNVDSANNLSTLLTVERLKKSGLAQSAETTSSDPDLEALREVVRSANGRSRNFRTRLASGTLKKLAGV
jgi:hypothetical protein